MTTPELLEVLEVHTLVESSGELQVELISSEPPMLIETAATQGPIGATGPMGPEGEVRISRLERNRLQMKDDGLHVLDDLAPDPVAYYILSRG